MTNCRFTVHNVDHAILPDQVSEACAFIQSLPEEERSFENAARVLRERFGLVCHLLQALRRDHASQPPIEQAVLVVLLARIFRSALANEEASFTKSCIDHLSYVEPKAASMLRMSIDFELDKAGTRDFCRWAQDRACSLHINPAAWLPSPPKTAVPVSPLTLSQSQRAALERLDGFLHLQQTKPTAAGIRPRTSALLVGPSGVGKTHVMRTFSEHSGLPLIDVNVGSWIIVGARSQPDFLHVLGEFVDRNPRGILFIDEVDKLSNGSEWSRCIQQEAYALLDRRLDAFDGWKGDRARRFSEDYLIVGAGTWQQLQPSRTKSVGFNINGSNGRPTHADLARQDSIPEELLFRFNADVVWIEPLALAELRQIIQTIHTDLGLSVSNPERLEFLAQRAAASGKQHRWLEALVSCLALRAKPKPPSPATSRTNLPGFDNP